MLDFVQSVPLACLTGCAGMLVGLAVTFIVLRWIGRKMRGAASLLAEANEELGRIRGR